MYLDQFGITPTPVALPQKFQDAYALWALQTNFRAFTRGLDLMPSELTFLVELNSPYLPASPFTSSSGEVLGARVITIAGVRLRVPRAYERPLPNVGNTTVHFITLRLWIADLTNETLRAVVMALMKLSGIKRLQIGFQRPGYDYPVSSDIYVPGPAASPPAPAKAPAVVLGIVEDACPFGHAAALYPGTLATRIVSPWDQSIVPLPVKPPWVPPTGFPYGKQLGQVAMNTLIGQHTVDGQVDEEALYADPLVFMPELMQRSSHAAAVLGLLAGETPLLGNVTPDDGVPTACPPTLAAADVSLRELPLVVVRLPREQTTISSGRWLAVNAVDAMHRIMGEARDLGQASMPPVQAPPLVVNVSYGAIAGPHDGTSLVEMALDELCNGYDNMAVVVAAGNAHGTVHDSDALDQTAVLAGGVHATQALLPGQAVRLTLQLPADKSFETYVELWFSDLAKPGADQWLDADEVAITVTGPDGIVRLGAVCGSACYVPNSEQAVAGLVFVRKTSQSLHRSMALLVLAATRVHADYVEAPAGRWTITLVSLRQPGDAGARVLSVQTWVERDDTTFGIDRPQSARLVPNDDGTAAHLNDQNIFSTLAGGQCSWSVGALVHPADALHQGAASAYTAAGPDNNHGPTVSAVADAGIALFGIRVAGSRSGMVLRSNGTSMAAPQAARYIAGRLAGGDSLAQIKASLPPSLRDARRGPCVP